MARSSQLPGFKRRFAQCVPGNGKEERYAVLPGSRSSYRRSSRASACPLVCFGAIAIGGTCESDFCLRQRDALSRRRLPTIVRTGSSASSRPLCLFLRLIQESDSTCRWEKLLVYLPAIALRSSGRSCRLPVRCERGDRSAKENSYPSESHPKCVDRQHKQPPVRRWHRDSISRRHIGSRANSFSFHSSSTSLAGRPCC